MSEAMITVIAQTVIFLLGVYGLILRNDYNNKGIKAEIAEMKAELKKLADVVVVQAVQTNSIKNLETQLVMLQRVVEELRRGEGWITRRKSVEGEYP